MLLNLTIDISSTDGQRVVCRRSHCPRCLSWASSTFVGCIREKSSTIRIFPMRYSMETYGRTEHLLTFMTMIKPSLIAFITSLHLLFQVSFLIFQVIEFKANVQRLRNVQSIVNSFTTINQHYLTRLSASTLVNMYTCG